MKIFKLALIPLLAGGLVMGGCTAEVEDEGELPEVNVEGGDAPNIDVDAADVDVTTDTQTVITPDVDVNPDTSGVR